MGPVRIGALIAVACVGLGVTASTSCREATALDVDVYSELPCDKRGAYVFLASSLEALGSGVPSATSQRCDSAGAEHHLGNVVVVPAATRDERLILGVVQRTDDGDPAACWNDATNCVIAKREFRFNPHDTPNMRVDLRASCVNKPCALDETCVGGACVPVTSLTCPPNCQEPPSDAAAQDAAPPLHVKIASGQAHTCALTLARAVKWWGDNTYHQLGDGTTQAQASATTVSLPGGTALAVVTGDYHTCVISNDRTVWCWGLDGASSPIKPTQVTGLTNVQALSAGYKFTCAELGDGTVTCWGSDSISINASTGAVGVLGDGLDQSRALPGVPVTGLAHVVGLSARQAMTCALLGDTTLRTWGENYVGALGDGLPPSGDVLHHASTPVTVQAALADGGAAPLSGATKVSLCDQSMCARLTNGGVSCWGNNFANALGDGMNATQNRSVAMPVVGLSGPAIDVSCGAFFCCAALASGAVQCWGDNGSFQNGGADASSVSVAVAVPGLTDVVSISTGDAFVCAVHANDSVTCSGQNASGRLGGGTMGGTSMVPVTVLGL